MKIIFIFTILSISLSSFAGFDQLIKQKIHTHKKATLLRGGGAMDGGGSGNNFPEQGAAWFYKRYAKGYISVCTLRDSKFKATEEEIENSIRIAFKTWDDYINSSDIYSDYYDDEGNEAPYPEEYKILTKIKFEPCHSDTDIEFYFGMINKKVKTILDNMVEPKGFAYRNYKDIFPFKGYSKGLIWIFNPETTQYSEFDPVIYDWSNPKLLQAMVNHEVGHVMGNGHIPGTVMEEDFEELYYLARSQNQRTRATYSKYLTKIDHGSNLVVGSEVFYKNSGTLGIPGTKEEKESFKLFMGRDLVGPSRIEIFAKDEKFYTRLSDDLGAKDIELHSQTNNYVVFNPQPQSVFKRYLKTKTVFQGFETIDYHEDFHFRFSAMLSSFMMINNKKFLIDMNINNGFINLSRDGKDYYIQNPLTIFYTHNNEKKLLFVNGAQDYESLNSLRKK